MNYENLPYCTHKCISTINQEDFDNIDLHCN